MKSKKSAIEVQFNWFFVLIIGAVILSFVFTVIRTQVESTQNEVDYTVRTLLDSVLQQASQSPGTLFDVQLRAAKLTSSDSCVDSFYLNDNRNLRIEMETAFTPKNMQSTQGTFFLWVLPWDMPFRITNFVYMTSPDIIYFLVYDDDTKDFVTEINFSRNSISLPDRMTKIVVNGSVLNDRLDELNHLITRVVYIKTSCPNSFNGIDPNSLVCIEVNNYNGGLDGWGKVRYYKGNTYDETYFLGRSSLFGSIFSEDIVQFDCSMQKAYQKMDSILDVYLYRSKNLTEYYGSHECSRPHNNAENLIEDIKNYLKISNISGIYDKSLKGVYSLSGYNTETKLKSCIYIY